MPNQSTYCLRPTMFNELVELVPARRKRETSRRVESCEMEGHFLRDLTGKELTRIALNNGFTNPRLEFGNAAEKGANFVSQVYRCVVTDDNDPRHRQAFIVKLPPSDPNLRSAIQVDGFFQIEAFMYTKVLPSLADCYKKRNLIPIDAPFPCTPRPYSLVDEDEEKLVVIEDLNAKGFVMKDRLGGLDATHCRFVLSHIARLHAASLALQRDDPTLHERLVAPLQENVFYREEISDNSKRSVKNFRGYIDERFPLGSSTRNKIESHLENYQSTMRDLVSRKDSSLCCITHGDLWINNMLFKYKEGSEAPEEVCFVDFQISRMSTPVLDIAYFLTLCAMGKTQRLYMDFVEHYHRSLCASLSDLGHNPQDIVPFSLLIEELRKYGRYGWMMAVMVLPLISLDHEDMAELHKLKVHPAHAHNSMAKKNTNIIKNRFVEVLEQAEQLGIL